MCYHEVEEEPIEAAPLAPARRPFLGVSIRASALRRELASGPFGNAARELEQLCIMDRPPERADSQRALRMLSLSVREVSRAVISSACADGRSSPA